jgi:hypothetical protein
MKVFIFAIGGTGARVLRSLTMLLASGVHLNPDVEFIPIIIDMDATNGDTIRTKNVINKYSSIRKKSYSENVNEGFFSPQLKNLASYKADNFKGIIQDTFQLEFGNVDQTFFKYIGADQLNYENDCLLESLFDNSPETASSNDSSTTELYLNLAKGFKGNPNIGSIVFNDLVNTNEYKYFEDICTEKDKVFVISSIFGGTGSSGFPQLVKNIRKSDKNSVKNVHIGAIVVMPYFLIARKSKSSIDSNNFNSKTKAALSYYATELDGVVNDTYYIGNNETGDAYDNNEGAEKQKNMAHIIELVSAISIIQFIKSSPTVSQDGNLDFKKYGFHYYEFGVRKESSSYDFRHFFPKTQTDIFLPLTKLFYFAKYYTEGLKDPSSMKAAFAKSLGLNEKLLISDQFYGELSSFLKDDFLGWIQELNRNKPQFSAFNLAEDYKKMISGQEYPVKLALFVEGMSKYEKKFGSITSTRERFMRIAYETINNIVEEKVKTLPSGENL